MKESTSGSGESAAVHFDQSDPVRFSGKSKKCDNDPAAVRTMKTLSVADSDVSAFKQEKEARSSGGILSQ